VLCIRTCNPLQQDCPAGAACYPKEHGFFCSPDMSGPDLGAIGDPCEYTNACDAGGWCATAETQPNCVESPACCAAFCNISDPDASATCLAGTECVAWDEISAVPPGDADVGACVIP
jgi:hypothetical protein